MPGVEDQGAAAIPLPADPARQAVDAWRGYYYQLLHTIHAWLDLPEEAVLYLEGAEDFDVIGPGEATAVQVKNSSGNITLRSRAVTDTITHYWQLHKAAPQRKILFKLLTRSSVTVESGEPFGPGLAGLELWERCAKGSGSCDALLLFLCAQERLPADLREFITSTNPPSVIEELIRPITWQTQSQSGGYVEEAIKRKLEFHGDKFGVPPSEAIRVLSRLLKEAFEAVCRKPESDRILDRSLFLHLFEEETRNVPSHQLQQLTQLASHLLPALLPSGDSLVGSTLTRFPLICSAIPPLPQFAHRRESLVTELLQKLGASGVLILTGSSGTGKTTLAKFIGQEVREHWFWLSLSGRESDQVNEGLRQAGAVLDVHPEVHSLILDGLDLDAAGLSMCEEHFGGVLHTVLSRRGRVIVTTVRSLPDRVLRRCGVQSSSIINVPPFTEDDIAAFAASLGCSDPDRAKLWATATMLHTRGHPQLVHARLHRLAHLQWPSMKPEDILQLPSEVVDEQSQARQLLSHADEDQRELLYRLSVIGGSFRRDHAIIIGESPPSVTYPGDVLDQLVGPWIEQAAGDYYRLSPLLDGAATQVWSAQRIQSINVTVARTLMTCPPVTTVEATTALLHAWKALDYGALIGIIHKMISANKEAFKALARDLVWLAWVGMTPQRPAIPDNPVANHVFRMLQFRVAAELNMPVAAEVARAWEIEVVPLQPEKLYLNMRLMLAMEVAIRYQVAVPANWLVARFREAVELQERLDLHLPVPSASSLPSWMIIENQEIDFVTTLFSFVWLRCTGHQFLEEFLEALHETPAPVRDRLLSITKRNEFLAALLVDRVFLKEYQSTDPNWDVCIQVLQRTISLGTEWHVEGLTAAAARILAVIHDESRGDHTQALAVLDSVEEQMGAHSPLLKDARANILYRRDEYRQALSIWETVLPSWLPPRDSEDISPLFAYRKAGIAAAKTGDWSRAASLFSEGASRSRDLGQGDWVVGFKADAGYALWRAGKGGESFGILAETLRLMEGLPDPKHNLSSFALRKFVGYVALWIKDVLTKEPTTDTPEPPPGLCSNHERSEKLRELPLPPLDVTWLLLLEAEHESGGDGALFDEEYPRLSQSRHPGVRASLARLAMHHAFRRLEFKRVPSLIRTLGTASAELRAHKASGMNLWEEAVAVFPLPDLQALDQTWGVQPFAASIFALVASARFNSGIFLDWKEDAIHLSNDGIMTETIAAVEKCMSLEVHEAVHVMRVSTDWGTRLLACIRVTNVSDVSPDDLFIAHVLLALDFLQGFWASDTVPYLVQMIIAQWLLKCEFPAALRSPRISVPSIRAACTNDSAGPKKAAQILLAASMAVSVRLPEDYLTTLRKLAGVG